MRTCSLKPLVTGYGQVLEPDSAGQQLLAAEDPLPDDLPEALTLITEPESAH